MENANLNRFDCRLYSLGKTVLCFVVFVICIQPLFFCYLIVSIVRLTWRNILIMKNPQLEFVKKVNLRSVSYTVRNPGIVNIILHLQGEPNTEMIRDALSRGVLQRKNKLGDLCFPKLMANLVTCWGHYAWRINSSSFNVDNHITVYPSFYRGRAVTEANIQDYISNIVSKYLPPDLPPWQICVIPLSNASRSEDVTASTSAASETVASESFEEQQSESSKISEQYYVIVRIHHLLLSEEPDLRLNDLLSIDTIVPATVLNNGEVQELRKLDLQIRKSPLTNVFTYPVYIPQLYVRLQMALTNFWNEFLCKYDPYVGNQQTVDATVLASATSNDFQEIDETKFAANPHFQLTTLTQLFAVLLISCVTILIDFYKGFYATKHHPMIKLKFLNNLVKREIRKRSITWECFWKAFVTSLSPIYVVTTVCSWICWASVRMTIMWPYLLYREYKAFRCCFFLGYGGYSNTLTGFLFAYIPLLYNAFKETLGLVGEFIQAPRFIYEELIQSNRNEEHVLQNISLCGRKVLSWSDKVYVKDIRNACLKYNVSPTELYMSAASSALMELMQEFESVRMPQQIRVFATHCVHDYLHGKLNSSDSDMGHLCLQLPMEMVSAKQLNQIHRNCETARKNQIGLYFLFLLHKRFNILTKCLPAVWTVIIFNYLSRRFTVSMTEITKSSSSPFQQRTAVACWGHRILDTLYFSPPQSNGSVALSIQQFGEHIQLGVITDAQIHPLHMKLSERWTKNLQHFY